MPHEYHTERIVWNGITIEIRYCESWLSSDINGYNTAHLEVEAINPAHAQLPMTETGYRSHFCQHADIIAHGSAVAFVEAWLEHEAQSVDWQAYVDTSRQGNLFGQVCLSLKLKYLALSISPLIIRGRAIVNRACFHCLSPLGIYP